MSGNISKESALRIAQVWNPDKSLRENMAAAGFEGDDRRIRRMRRQAEEILGSNLLSNSPFAPQIPTNTVQIEHSAPYTCMAFSDAHFWPGEFSDSYWIFLQVLEDVKPAYVFNVGDSLDGATIGRHDPSGWTSTPGLAEEIAASREALDGIRAHAGNARLWWTLGNHDMRFDSFLVKHAPQMLDVQGSRLIDHFPGWETAMSIWLNNHSIIKHRWHTGIHGAYNNALKSGKTMITGHTHRLLYTPWTDFNGTRYGIECGMLNNPNGSQFAYGEDNPVNHRQGFVVFTIDGKDIYPEMVEVKNHQARFRGRVYKA